MVHLVPGDGERRGHGPVIIGAIAGAICLGVLFIGTSFESWEAFWDRVAESIWWW